MVESLDTDEVLRIRTAKVRKDKVLAILLSRPMLFQTDIIVSVSMLSTGFFLVLWPWRLFVSSLLRKVMDGQNPPLINIIQEVGTTVYNPFIPKSKKGKGKNAADVALVLSAIEDLLIKKIPVDAVVIATCDIDLYPAIRWLKEHINLPIILASFKERINNTYLEALNPNEIWFLNATHYNYTIKALERGILNYLKIIENKEIKALPREEDLNYLEVLAKTLTGHSETLNAIKKLSELQKTNEDDDVDVYITFKEKVIKGLESWLKKENYAKTGLIIKSWLPRWELGIDEATANEYLKRFLEEELPKHPEITFNGEERDGVIIGEFRLNES